MNWKTLSRDPNIDITKKSNKSDLYMHTVTTREYEIINDLKFSSQSRHTT